MLQTSSYRTICKHPPVSVDQTVHTMHTLFTINQSKTLSLSLPPFSDRTFSPPALSSHHNNHSLTGPIGCGQQATSIRKEGSSLLWSSPEVVSTSRQLPIHQRLEATTTPARWSGIKLVYQDKLVVILYNYPIFQTFYFLPKRFIHSSSFKHDCLGSLLMRPVPQAGSSSSRGNRRNDKLPHSIVIIY